MKEFNRLIKDICEELEIKMTLLSENWLTILEKNNKIKCIQGYKFPLNDHGIGNVMDDKGLFYDLMIYKNNPIIEHKVLFKESSIKDIDNYFFENNNILIVKGNIGTCGKEVFLVDNIVDLHNTIKKLFTSQFSISLCPYYQIKNEYRAICLDGKVKILYGKRRPLVVGDGIHNLLELFLKFNKEYFSHKKHQDFYINYIPKVNEEYAYNFQFNLSRGARAFFDVSDEVFKNVSKIALKVCQDANIVFGSVDIIETMDNHFLIMEANSGVMMQHILRQTKDYNLVKEIYKEAIMLMFKD